MNRIRKLIYIIPIVVLLAACGQIPPAVSTSTLPANTAILPPTATFLPMPTATVDLLQDANIVEKCPTILPSADLSKIKADGVLVLLKSRHPYDLYQDDIRHAYLLNLANNQLFEFSQRGENLSYYSSAVSPDRKTLAYGILLPENESAKLIISNSKGERQKTIPQEGSYPMGVSIQRWLNNQQLLLIPYTVFNPYSEEKQSFLPEDFPNILPDDFGGYSLDFDSELTRVIYPHSHATTAMADLATKQILAEIPAQYRGAPKVAWSPNNNLIAMVGAGQAQEGVADEIFLIDRDGKEIKQITHLSAYYGVGYILFNLSWSSDGNRISFWQAVDTPNARELRLFVLNTRTEELTRYCTWGETTGITFYGPIWSPDGTQLLIGDFSVKDTVRAVIIDIARNVAVPIADDEIPVGWMLAP